MQGLVGTEQNPALPDPVAPGGPCRGAGMVTDQRGTDRQGPWLQPPQGLDVVLLADLAASWAPVRAQGEHWHVAAGARLALPGGM